MSRRWRNRLAVATLLLAPLLLLGPCVFGARTFVPFDIAQWPPLSTKLTAEQLAEIRRCQNADVTEVPLTFLPEWRFAGQEIAHGRLPEWNPYARRGVPLLATAVVGLLYPFNWLLLAFDDPADGLELRAWIAFAAALLLTFGLLRALGLRPAAAVFGAMSFAFSGTLVANAYFYQRLDALVWLPGMLWAVLGVVRPGRAGRAWPAAALAGCLAATWLAGFPPYAAAATLVAAAFAFCLVWVQARSAGSGPAVRCCGFLVAAGLIGLAVACVQLVPMFAFFPESNRTVAPTPDSLAKQTFDPAGLLGFLMPDPFGHPTRTSELPYDRSIFAFWLFRIRSWEHGGLLLPRYNYTEFTVFPGSLTLLLAVAGIVGGASKWRRFFAGAAAGLLLLAIAPGPVSTISLLPGIRNVPPVRFLGPVCLAVAVLAAFGLDRMLESARAGGARLAGWTGLALAAATGGVWLWLGGQDPESLARLLRDDIFAAYRDSPEVQGLTPQGIAAYFGDLPRLVTVARGQALANARYATLWLAGAGLALLLAARLRPRAARGLLALGAVATLGQLLALAHGVAGGRELPYTHDSDVHAFLREQRDKAAARGGFTVVRGSDRPGGELALILPPCTLVPERIRDVNIYTFTDRRAHLPFLELYGPGLLARGFWVNALPDDERLQRPLFDLLGVRYVLAKAPLRHAGRRTGPEWKGPGGEFFVYERSGALPRAFVVPDVLVLPDEKAVVRRMVAPDFRPARHALLTKSEHERLRAAMGATPLPAGSSLAAAREVRFVRDTPVDVELEIGDGPPGYLVLTDTFMPGWTARANGRPTPMVRGDLNLRVVPVPAGPLRVRFRYATPGLALGMLLSALGLAGVSVLLGLGWRARRSTPAT